MFISLEKGNVLYMFDRKNVCSHIGGSLSGHQTENRTKIWVVDCKLFYSWRNKSHVSPVQRWIFQKWNWGYNWNWDPLDQNLCSFVNVSVSPPWWQFYSKSHLKFEFVIKVERTNFSREVGEKLPEKKLHDKQKMSSL